MLSPSPPWGWLTAAAFSNLGITVDSRFNLVSFGDIRIARSVSGVGINGISVSSLTFKCSGADAAAMTGSGLAAPVVVSGIANLPTFYIDERAENDDIWTVSCVDVCACLDKPITGLTASNGQYLMSAVFDKLKADCNVSQISVPSGLPTYINREKIDGKTYQSVLQEISESYCGFWCSHYTNTIEFVSYNQIQSGETLTNYSKVHTKGSFAYSSVQVTNGTENASWGSGDPALKISNDFADVTNSNLYSGIPNHNFYGWSIDKAISPSAELPLIGGILTMNNTNYRVTKSGCYVAGNSLIISAGGDIPQYGEINRRGLLQQRLDNAVSTDKTYGTIKPTNDKDLGFVATPNQTGA